MEQINMEGLSLPATAIAGVKFGMTTSLTFQMIEGRPSPQMQAALDELVEKGVIKVEIVNQLTGAIEYRPLVDCRPAWDWVGANRNNPALKFPITETIPPEERDTEATLTRRDREIKVAKRRGEVYQHPIAQRIRMKAA